MKLAFIGTGNMGGALARAAALEEDNELLLVNRHPEKAEKLRAEIGGIVTDHAGAVAGADLLFLGVKPVVLPTLCETLRPLLQKREGRFVVVSMVAGVPIRKLQGELGEHLPIIRIMPNTPVAVGEGMILYSCSEEVREEEVQSFLRVMRHAGCFMKIEERLMEVEALADAAVACGIPRKDAIRLSAQMVLGSAKLILESGRHPGELKDAVCSPGGTTIQGVRALEARAFRSAVFEAVIAAHDA